MHVLELRVMFILWYVRNISKAFPRLPLVTLVRWLVRPGYYVRSTKVVLVYSYIILLALAILLILYTVRGIIILRYIYIFVPPENIRETPCML